MSCQSEGALQIYIEPVLPPVHLVVVGQSPMARMLTDLAGDLGWRADLVGGEDFTSAHVDQRSVVVVATQGHGDEDVVRARGVRDAGVRRPGRLAASAARRCSATSPTAASRSTCWTGSARPSVSTSGVRRTRRSRSRSSPSWSRSGPPAASRSNPCRTSLPVIETAEALDPICGMTVPADDAHFPVEHDGSTYHFCCVGCRDAFLRKPEA